MRPPVVGAARERMRAVPSRTLARGAVPSPLGDHAVLSDEAGPIAAVPDGNRSVTLPDVAVAYAGRDFLLSVKGAGAGAALFDDLPVTGAPPRVVAAESWMGDAPYGGQGERGARDALALSALADERSTLGGACVCPVIAIVEIPDAHVREDCLWYRRHRGLRVQEHRLVPSDVRLFHGTEGALARDPERALVGLGVEDVAALDAFADRYLATGVAALTLWARTAREGPDGLEGLDYEDVWLDKDSLLAPDGSLFLVDLESIEWTPVTSRRDAEARIRRQVDRNHYDLFYGLDAILGVRDRWLDRAPDRAARRESVAARIALALAGDPVVGVEDVGDGVDLCVGSPGVEPVRVRIIDRR